MADPLVMVGNGRSCLGCGAPLRKDYGYCNSCGRKSCAVSDGRKTVTVNPPKILPPPAPQRKEAAKDEGSGVPRRDLVIALLAMTCMSPFCTWLSSFGGLVGISAAFNEAFYGGYIALLAAAGLLALMAGRALPAAFPRKVMIAGVGFATLTLTALDFMEIVKYNADLGPSLMEASPGMGMYLAFVLGAGLALAALVPQRCRTAVRKDRPVLRPGSQGSDPSARR